MLVYLTVSEALRDRLCLKAIAGSVPSWSLSGFFSTEPIFFYAQMSLGYSNNDQSKKYIMEM